MEKNKPIARTLQAAKKVKAEVVKSESHQNKGITTKINTTEIRAKGRVTPLPRIAEALNRRVVIIKNHKDWLMIPCRKLLAHQSKGYNKT